MEEIDLKQVIKTAYKNRKILLGIIVVTILLGVIYSFVIVRPEYQSNSKMLIIGNNDASIKEFVKSEKMIQKVTEELNNSKVNTSTMRTSTEVSFDTSSRLVSVSALTRDKSLSNEIVHKYIDVLKKELEDVYGIKNCTVIQEATEASSSSNINHQKDLMVVIVLGVAIAGVYVIIVYFINNKMNATAIEESTEIKVIGKLKKEKKNKKVIDYFMHDNSNLSTLNKMAITIQKANKDQKVKSILVSGTGLGAGSTYVTTNLANTYAKLGYRVLVIDANKNGIQNKIFNRNMNKGFSDLVLRMQNTDIENINMDEYIAKTPIEGISVMAYGEEKLNEKMLISDRSMQIFNQIASRFDIVIIDAPSMKKDITTLVLSTYADSVILVAETEKTKLDDIKEVKESLQNIDLKIDGIILNKIDA